MKRPTVLLASSSKLSERAQFRQVLALLQVDFDVALLSADTNCKHRPNDSWVFEKTPSLFRNSFRALVNRLRIGKFAELCDQLQLFTNLSQTSLHSFNYIVVLDLRLLPLFKQHLDKVIFDTASLWVSQSNQDYFDRLMPMWLGRYYWNKYVSRSALIYSHSLATKTDLVSMVGEERSKLCIPSLYIANSAGERHHVKRNGTEKRVVTIFNEYSDANDIAVLNVIASRLLESVVLTVIASPHNTSLLKALVTMTMSKPNVHLMTEVPTNRIHSLLSQFDCAVYFPQVTKQATGPSLGPELYQLALAELPILSLARDESAATIETFQIGKVLHPDELVEYLERPLEEFLSALTIFKSALKNFKQHLSKVSVNLCELLVSRLNQ